MRWDAVSYFYKLVLEVVHKVKNHIIFASLSLTIYLVLGYFKISFFFPMYLFIVVGIDLLVKRKNTFALYFAIPLLSTLLLFFDPDSIFRSLKYILTLPALYFLKSFTMQKRLTVSAILVLGFHFFINPNWEQFYINQSIPEHSISSVQDLKIKNINGQELKLKKDKTYLLDFWFTSCKGCFSGMEKFNRWSENDSIRFDKIILVNVIMEKETFLENTKLVDDYGFKSTYTELSFDELKSLGIYEYPSHLIVKNGKVLYKGRLTTNSTVVNNIGDYLKD
jgi:thiol-disulfide isomerase/thioredoxin